MSGNARGISIYLVLNKYLGKKDFQIVFGKSENTNKKYHQTYIKPKKNGDLYFDDKVSDHTISLVLFYLFYLFE